jgi:hypothetical protein
MRARGGGGRLCLLRVNETFVTALEAIKEQAPVHELLGADGDAVSDERDSYKSPCLSDTYVLLLPLHCGRSTSRSRSGSLGGAR